MKWVSTDWLVDHLEDKSLMILDVQPNIHDHIHEHIPGAIYLNEGLLRDVSGNQPAVYVSPRSIELGFSCAGL